MSGWEHPWFPYWRQIPESETMPEEKDNAYDSPNLWMRSNTGNRIHYVLGGWHNNPSQKVAACGRVSSYYPSPGFVGPVCTQCVDRLMLYYDPADLDRLTRPVTEAGRSY